MVRVGTVCIVACKEVGVVLVGTVCIVSVTGSTSL